MKRIALVCSLLLSFAYSQSFEYLSVVEAPRQLSTKMLYGYEIAGSNLITEDSTGVKFENLVDILNYLGAQGWEMIAITEQTGMLPKKYYLMMRRKENPHPKG